MNTWSATRDPTFFAGCSTTVPPTQPSCRNWLTVASACALGIESVACYRIESVPEGSRRDSLASSYRLNTDHFGASGARPSTPASAPSLSPRSLSPLCGHVLFHPAVDLVPSRSPHGAVVGSAASERQRPGARKRLVHASRIIRRCVRVGVAMNQQHRGADPRLRGRSPPLAGR